jgi:propanol-preferring alcohol dehydrogenase
MRAAVLDEFGRPLQIREVEDPSPGPDEVLIRVEACGVCHSDLHLAEGDWPQLARIMKKPLILGHEVVGRVIERGGAVCQLQVGDRVGVAWLHWSCGQCAICNEGRENLCPNQLITGVTVDGGYAELIKAKASHAIKVPPELNSEQAAPLFCAGVTVYRAIKNAQVEPGWLGAVFGVGGLGHLAVQIAKSFGMELIAVDIADQKLEFARSLGADFTMNAASSDVVSELKRRGGVNLAVVTSASKAAYDSAFYSLRPGGTLVVVGLPAEPLSFPALAIVAAEAKIIGSAVGTRQDLKEVLELAASGKLRCQIESYGLEHINEIFDIMRAAKLTGRAVLSLARE